MAKKVNAINGIQANDTTMNAVVSTRRTTRRGKTKDVAIQSHAHVDEYTRKLEIGKAKAAQKAADYKVMCDRLDEAYDKYAKHMADAFGEGVRLMMRNSATIQGNENDYAAAKEREFVAAANGRDVAHALHMADEFTVAEAVADSTVKTATKTATKKTTKTATKKTATKKTAAKKTTKTATKTATKTENPEMTELTALYNQGLISETLFKAMSAKFSTENVESEKKTAPRRRTTSKGGRKVDMTNIRTITAKNGVEYMVGDFTHTQTGEKLYGVWMESKTDDGVKWLKDTFGVHYSPFAAAFVFNYKPDTYLKSGKAKKTTKKTA